MNATIKAFTLLVILEIAFWLIVMIFLSTASYSAAKTVGPTKDYTLDQKIRRGDVLPHKMTTCRLKKRVKTRSGEQVCVYVGAQQTYEMQVENWCPKQYQCRYNPGQKEPNINDVVDSLNSISK